MRTIKFRVFDKHKKYMHELDALFLDEKMFRVQNYKNEHDVFSFGTEYFSEPMQFTGLLDKNGIEIYEGDVVKNEVYIEGNKHVEYHNGSFGYKILIDDSFVWYAFCENTYFLSDIEVIGNIFQHPHLLEANHEI